MELSVKINAAIDGFISAMKAANGEVQKLVGSTGRPITVNADTEQAKKALNGLQSEIKETQSELGKLGGDGALDGLKKSFAEGREQASSGGGIFGSIASSAGQILSPVGAATAAIGLLGAGLTATFTIGKEFETGLQSVSAVTGVTGAALEDIGNRAQAAAAKYGGSASDQLGVFQTALSKIGPQLAQDADSLSSFSDSVNTLSKTDSALGAQGAVDALSGSLLQFGVNVNDTKEVAREGARFMNVMAAGAAAGSATVANVADSIKVAGSSLKNANISFEESNAAIQVLGKVTLYGSQGGTALTAVVNKLQAASGPAADQLKTMGTSSEKLGKILTTQGIGAAMNELRGAMKNLGSDAEKNAFLVSMFGETGMNAAAALLSSGDDLKKWTKDVTGTNAATEQAAINMNTLSERMSRAKAGLENVFINVYRFVEPILVSLIDGVSTAFDTIYNIIAPVVTGIGNLISAGIGAILPIFEGLKNAAVNAFNSFGGLQGIIGGISQALQVLAIAGAGVLGYFAVSNAAVIANTVATTANTVATNAAAAVKATINAVTTAYTALTSASTYATIAQSVAQGAAAAKMAIMTGAQYALNLAMSLNPIGIVVAGLAALVAGIVYAYNHFEGFRNVVNNVWERIKTFGLAVLNIVSYMNPFTAAFRLAYDKIKPFKDFIDGLVNTIKNVGGAIGDFFSSVGGAIGDAFSGGVNDGLDKIDSKGAAGKIEKDMKAAIAEVKLSLNTLTLGKLFDEAKSNADGAKTAAINQASGVQNAFEKLAKAQKGNEAERLAALEAFKTASGATDIATYEQAKKIADKAREDLAKTQRENLDKARELKKIESANSIEEQEKENQKAITNKAKADKLKLDTDKFNAEKAAKSRVATEEETQLQMLEIQKKTDAANFDVKIKEAKRQAAANKVATTQESAAAQLNIKQLEFDKLKSAYDTEQKINDIKGKALLKAFDDAQKRQADFAKSEIEAAKTNAEKIAQVEGSAKNSDDGLKAILATNAAKRKLIDIQNEYEVEQTIEKNLQVIKANEILRKAIASGDSVKIDTAGAAVLDAINIAEKTDAAVAAVKLKNQIELDKVEKENAEKLLLFRISLITDSAERERQTRLIEVQKTLDAELLAAKGNERLILDARRKATAEREAIEEDAARKSQDYGVRFGRAALDIAKGFSANFSASLSPIFDTFGAIEKRFQKFADTVAKSNEDVAKSTEEEYKKATDEAYTQLKKREIDYKQYTAIVDKAAEKNGNNQVGITAQVNAAIGKSFLDVGKQASLHLKETFGEMGKQFKDADGKFKKTSDIIGTFFDSASKIVSDTSVIIGSSLGILAASGELTMKSAGKAILGTAFDTVSSLILTYIPAIFGSAVSFLGPIAGPIAAGLLTGVVQGLLATAKGALGFWRGGYTGDGGRMEEAGVVHKGEGVLEQPIMSGQVSDFLEMRKILQSGVPIRALLDGAKMPSLSSSAVSTRGELIQIRTAEIAASRTDNTGAYIRALENQTAVLLQSNKELKSEIARGNGARRTESTVNIPPVRLTASGNDLVGIMEKKQNHKLQFGG